MDTLTPEQRSACMSLVRSKDSKPEMIVRKLLHSRGYRYRLHDKRLPGKPDLTFTSRGKVIFVNGCFWHMHEGCPHAGIPESRIDFWQSKLERNRARDQMNITQLEKMGWRVLVVWQCELQDIDAVTNRLERFLKKGNSSDEPSVRYEARACRDSGHADNKKTDFEQPADPRRNHRAKCDRKRL